MADSIMVMGLSLILINSTMHWPLSASKDFYFRSTKKFSNALPMYRSENIFMWSFLKVWTYLSFLEHPPAKTTNRSRYIMQDIAPRFFYFLNHTISMPSFYFLIVRVTVCSLFSENVLLFLCIAYANLLWWILCTSVERNTLSVIITHYFYILF